MQQKSVVVVGGGLMGCDIAAIFAKAGWLVQLVEPNAANREAAADRIRNGVNTLGGQWDAQRLKTVTAPQEANWEAVQLVIETASEDLSIKQSIFETLDECVPVHIPIGSNSSGFRITDITARCATAHRMANSHFFLPAHIVPLVELAKGERTSEAALDALQQGLEAVDRVVVRINKDLPGFLANRMQHALMREAFNIIDTGLATPDDVDKAVRYGFGFRYAAAGPIVQKELSGLDTQLVAASNIYPSLCNDPGPPASLVRLVQEGRLGTKVRHGYWKWTDEQVAQERARFESAMNQAAQLVRESPSHIPTEHVG